MAVVKTNLQSFILFHCVIVSQGTPSSRGLFAKKDFSFFEHTYTTITSRSSTECCIHCYEDDVCRSVNFTPNDGTCEMNNRSPLDFPYTNIQTTVMKDLYIRIAEPCPESWSPYDGHCYHVGNLLRSWGDSQAHCQMLGANLTDITDEYENRFVVELVMDTFQQLTIPVWIGLANIHSTTPWQWTTGKRVEYVNFLPLQPSNSLGNEECVELLGYQWNDRQCNSLNPCVCKKKHY